MCGIIGYIGKEKRAVHVLIEGLKALEYRGYDSAGVAFVKNNSVEILKEVGKIKNLERLVNYEEETKVEEVVDEPEDSVEEIAEKVQKSSTKKSTKKQKDEE